MIKVPVSLRPSFIHYRPQLSWGKVIFSEALCQQFCPRGDVRGCSGGACMVARGGMHGFIWGGVRGFIWGACVVLFGGHAWFYSGGQRAWFYSGGMRGFIQGACMVLFGGVCMVLFGGHVWFYSGGGMRGFIQRGACVVLFSGGVHGFIQQGGRAWFFQFFGYNEIRSMSGRYASYWNAFLFNINST